MSKTGEIVKELRKSRDWSQEILADKLGVSRSCLANWEQGTRKIDAEQLEAIADLFNVDMKYLRGTQDVKRINPLDLFAGAGSCTVDYAIYDEDTQKIIGILSTMDQRQIKKVARYAQLILEDEI